MGTDARLFVFVPLALCAGAMHAQELSPAAQEAAAALKAFADDGLPKQLELAPTAKGAAAAKALGRLGAKAHEVAFGTLRSSQQALPAHFVEAFAGIEPTALWSVPLLVECMTKQSPNALLAVQVLHKLGDAAGCAVPDLRAALAGGKLSPQVQQEVNALLRSLKPTGAPPRPAPPAPAIAAGLTDGLLEILDRRPAQAWPALQALLRIGDDAAFEAALRLCAQLQNSARTADARRLLDVVHATYRARVSADPAGPWGLPRPARDAAVRRFILANHQPAAILQWNDELRTANAGMRRTLALAAALRSPQGQKDPFVAYVLAHPDEIPPADVRPIEAAAPQPQRIPNNPFAVSAAELVQLLRQLDAGPPPQRMLAQSRLEGAAIDTFPAEAVPLALAAMAPHRLQGFVERHLWKAGAAAVKPVLDAWPKADENGRRALVSVLARINPASAASVAFVLEQSRNDKTQDGMAARQALSSMRRPDVFAVALQLLQRQEARADVLLHLADLLPEDPKALAPRTDELLALLPELAESQRQALLWRLTAEPREGLELIHRWLDGDRPELRLAAVRLYAARTNDPKWAATILQLLRDPDPGIAEAATLVSSAADEQRAEIAAALLERWPKASPNMQAAMVRAFERFGPDAAAAKPLLEPRLQAPGWGARLAAAMALLALDEAHQDALAVVRALLHDADAYTRRAALNGLQGHAAVAERLASDVAGSLDDKDMQVVLEALYVCHVAPVVAKDKRARLDELAGSDDPAKNAGGTFSDWGSVADWARRVRERLGALPR